MLAGLGVILLSAEWFTNGVEALGRKFSFSQAVVGSLLAAVGTALPETILPLVAIFTSREDASHAIGIGAILGAPFMLATLGFFLIGVTVFLSGRQGGRPPDVMLEMRTARRDLVFFIGMYSSAIFLPMYFGHAATPAVAVFLLLGYIYYVSRTVRGDSAALEHLEGLHILRVPQHFNWVRCGDPGLRWIVLQVVLSLAVMVGGAHLFVKSLTSISLAWGMDPLLFALLLAPVATELPEKFNSVVWVLKKKDGLAVGNMTGAMVFQATFPVSVGLLCTDWQLSALAFFSAAMAILSAVVLLAAIHFCKRVSPWLMMLGGVLYFIYAVVAIVNMRTG